MSSDSGVENDFAIVSERFDEFAIEYHVAEQISNEYSHQILE